jgi:hypothetical protein
MQKGRWEQGRREGGREGVRLGEREEGGGGGGRERESARAREAL